MSDQADGPSAIPPDIAEMSFEAALAELEAIVRRLEEGQGALDEAITAYERGAALRRHCENRLRDAEAKVQRITRNGAGEVGLENMDHD